MDFTLGVDADQYVPIFAHLWNSVTEAYAYPNKEQIAAMAAWTGEAKTAWENVSDLDSSGNRFYRADNFVRRTSDGKLAFYWRFDPSNIFEGTDVRLGCLFYVLSN